MGYLQTFFSHLSNRDIMLYSFHPAEEDFLDALGISGNIDYTQTLDFDYPVYTSLSGNKSDRYMQRLYTKKVQYDATTCRIHTSFTLSQRHTFHAQDKTRIENEVSEFGIEDPDVLQIQGDAPNKQFIRVLIPDTAENVELENSMNVVDYGVRKGIEFYTTVLPTQRIDDSFSYDIPNPDCLPYTYKLYKQP